MARTAVGAVPTTTATTTKAESVNRDISSSEHSPKDVVAALLVRPSAIHGSVRRRCISLAANKQRNQEAMCQVWQTIDGGGVAFCALVAEMFSTSMRTSMQMGSGRERRGPVGQVGSCLTLSTAAISMP